MQSPRRAATWEETCRVRADEGIGPYKGWVKTETAEGRTNALSPLLGTITSNSVGADAFIGPVL